MFSTVKI